MSLSPASIQKMLVEALRSSQDLRKIPADFLKKTLSGHAYTEEALQQAVASIYKRISYSCTADLKLDRTEKTRMDELRRILKIEEDEAHTVDYQVGLSVYKKRFKDAVSDGELTTEENAELKSVGDFFGLQKRDIKKTIEEQALWYYSFKLAEALKDSVLTEDEMAELALISKRCGLTTNQLSTIPVPDKMEILRAALSAIKAKGSIEEEDYDHIRSLTRFLNAKELLKPCTMDLDLYNKLFRMRKGELQELDPGSLILESGEHLHHKAAVIYQLARGGTTLRKKGTLYVGSVKLRFIGEAKSHEIRYKNILEVSFQNVAPPRIQITVSSGKGSGTYRLSKKNTPSALLELQEMIGYLIRKARRMIEPTGKGTPYVPEHVRSEVYARDAGACVICGAREYLEFDHIIPRSKGGANTVNNLQLLCRKCNSQKSDRI